MSSPFIDEELTMTAKTMRLLSDPRTFGNARPVSIWDVQYIRQDQVLGHFRSILARIRTGGVE